MADSGLGIDVVFVADTLVMTTYVTNISFRRSLLLAHFSPGSIKQNENQQDNNYKDPGHVHLSALSAG